MSAGKKKVTQQDLRRLMNEHKKNKPKKIISPVAKYNDIGQLTCTLCKNVVISEALWETHKRSKQHLESIARLKKEIEPKAVHEWKRPADVSPQPPPKKLKGILKNAPPRPDTPPEAVGIAPDSPGNNQQIASTEESALPTKPPSLSNVLRNVPQHDKKIDPNIPENFFDPPHGSSSAGFRGRDLTHNADGKTGLDDALPEGFFDDPLLDAKARNIEYKNPVEEEWEKFQKEIKEESTVSAQIISEDQDEATVQRQLDEIDEQMKNWSRVLNMEVKKEQIAQELGKKVRTNVDSSSGEESDFEEYLNWRVKKAFD